MSIGLLLLFAVASIEEVTVILSQSLDLVKDQNSQTLSPDIVRKTRAPAATVPVITAPTISPTLATGPDPVKLSSSYWTDPIPVASSDLVHDAIPTDKSDCQAPTQYQLNIQQHVRIQYVTAKFGHGNRFRSDIESRRKQAIDRFPWLNETNTFGYYEFPEYLLQDSDFAPHLQFLQNETHPSATGGGWWFWKPQLILHHLQQLDTNDILVYADYDQVPWWPTLTDIIELVVTSPIVDLVTPRWVFDNEEYRTKRDVLTAYCGRFQPQLYRNPQYDAGLQIIRKSVRTIALARFWADAARNYHAISDEASYGRENGNLQEHRRDQSLLNVQLKCQYHLHTWHLPHHCGWLYGQKLIGLRAVALGPRKSPERNATAVFEALRKGEID